MENWLNAGRLGLEKVAVSKVKVKSLDYLRFEERLELILHVFKLFEILAKL